MPTRPPAALAPSVLGATGPAANRAERADRTLWRAERRLALASELEVEARTAREEWEVEREHLVAALHDRMRNPLTTLTGYVELLLDGVVGPLSSEQVLMLERVRAASGRLTGAVEELVPRQSPPREE